MNDAARNDIWVDTNLFNENFSKFSYEELLKYAGQYLGVSIDGTQILAAGADELDMERKLRERGIDPSRVVGMYLPRPDEGWLL